MTQAVDTNTLILKKLEEVSDNISGMKSDISDIKVSQARTEERLNSLEANLAEFKAETATKFNNQREDIKSTDKRLWTLIVGVVLALFGLLAKMAFLPTGIT